MLRHRSATEVQLLKIRIREGETERLTSFLRSLSERPDEVQASLASEGIVAESLFVERTDEGDWLYFFTRARDLRKAAEVFRTSELPLDVETREMIGSTWEEVTALEPLTDLVRSVEVEGERSP